MTSDEVVIGVDLGTTSTKAVAFDTGGRQLATASAGYPLDEPHPGWAEQDPAQILDAVLDTVRAVVSEVDGPVAALSFSSAMHTLIGLDADRGPAHPVAVLGRLAGRRAGRPAAGGPRRPGPAPADRHAGAPDGAAAQAGLVPRAAAGAVRPGRLLGRHQGLRAVPAVRRAGHRPVGRLRHRAARPRHAVLGPGGAQLAGIGPERLPELVPTTTVLSGLSAEVADRLGLPAATPVVAGAGDGPLANLGLGAVHPGVAACSIGTSGALRVTVERPAVDPLGGVFCYALTEHRWVVGGAINNGGIVLDWAGRALAPDLGDQPAEALLELAGRVPPGSGGLVMLPYLLGERAPHWSGLPLGAYVGLTREHRREHLVRAAIEGVCLQLALVLESMRAAGNEVHEVRATGGFARSPLWRQILADALGLDVRFPAGHEGSGFGAALLGMYALGLVDSLDVAADLVRIEDTVWPDPSAAAVYAALRPVFADLYDALVPTFRSLHGLSGRLPVD